MPDQPPPNTALTHHVRRRQVEAYQTHVSMAECDARQEAVQTCTLTTISNVWVNTTRTHWSDGPWTPWTVTSTTYNEHVHYVLRVLDIFKLLKVYGA